MEVRGNIAYLMAYDDFYLIYQIRTILSLPFAYASSIRFSLTFIHNYKLEIDWKLKILNLENDTP